MSQEIIYTSAPKGLRRGSRGFCTVVSTDGMARNLADRLEALSGYRHAVAANDPNGATNPVNFSHVVFMLTGHRFHVLSRIADAGFDYSGRTNKIAHHVALTDADTRSAPGGPAWALADKGFAVREWSGTTAILPTGRSPRTDDRGPAICNYWKQLSGDAGWGGVMAEAGASTSSQPIHVIFAPGTDVFPLVVESLALLPSELRWKVTFSTYFTKEPPGTSIRWRFLLDGTHEANALRRNPHAAKIDLCAQCGVPPASKFVDAARAGRLVEMEKLTETLSGSSARLRAWKAQTHQDALRDRGARGETLAAPPDVGPPEFNYGEPQRYSYAETGRVGWPVQKLAIGGLAVLLLVMMLLAGILIGHEFGVARVEQVAQQTESQPTSEDVSAGKNLEEQPPPRADNDVPKEPDPPVDSEAPVDDAQPGDAEDDSANNSDPDKSDELADASSTTEYRDPFPDLVPDDGRLHRLALPPLPRSGPSDAVHLFEVSVSDPAAVEIVLQSEILEMLVADSRPLILEADPPHWDVVISEINPFRPSEITNTGIARFTLDDSGLAFQWMISQEDNSGPTQPRDLEQFLKWSVARITVAGGSRRVLLSEPTRSKPVAISKAFETGDWRFLRIPSKITNDDLKVHVVFTKCTVVPSSLTLTQGALKEKSVRVLRRDDRQPFYSLRTRFFTNDDEPGSLYLARFGLSYWCRRLDGNGHVAAPEMKDDPFPPQAVASRRSARAILETPLIGTKCNALRKIATTYTHWAKFYPRADEEQNVQILATPQTPDELHSVRLAASVLHEALKSMRPRIKNDVETKKKLRKRVERQRETGNPLSNKEKEQLDLVSRRLKNANVDVGVLDNALNTTKECIAVIDGMKEIIAEHKKYESQIDEIWRDGEMQFELFTEVSGARIVLASSLTSPIKPEIVESKSSTER